MRDLIQDICAGLAVAIFAVAVVMWCVGIGG